jgi:hypothetical protein
LESTGDIQYLCDFRLECLGDSLGIDHATNATVLDAGDALRAG